MLKKLLSFFEEDVDNELTENELPPVSTRLLSPTIEQPGLKNEKKDCEGSVTGIYDTYGLIDNEIYFTIDNVSEFRMPSVGDRVHVLAERGQQGSGGWRATSVYLTSNQNDWDSPDYDPNKEGTSYNVSTSYCPDDSAKVLQRKEQDEFIMQNRILQDNFSQTLSDLLINKGNICITDSIDFGKIELGDSTSAQLHIRNDHTTTRTLYSMSIQLANSFYECQFELSGARLSNVSVSEVSRKTQESLPLILDPEQSATVTVYCHAKKLGRERLLVVFEVDDFYIGRTLSVNVHDSKYSVEAAEPFQRKSLTGGVSTWSEDGDVWIIPGQRPSRSSAGIRQSYRVSQYSLPESLRACMMNGRNIGAILPCLNQNLSSDNYKARFSALLHLEEFQQELEMREFDMHGVSLRPMGEFLSITVLGLAEGRPSLLVGDRVFISRSNDRSSRCPIYEGFIHEVQRSEVLIKFCEDFHIQYNFEGCNVKFAFNRSTLRRCHAAVESVSKNHRNVIFPERFALKPSQILPIKTVSTAAVPSNGRGSYHRATSMSMQRDSRVNSLVERGNIALVKPVNVEKSAGVKRCPSQPSQMSRSQALYCTKYYNQQLNVIQKRAVQRILRGEARPLPYIIFGPPGTGKTVTVVEAILQIFHKVPDSRLLICAPSNSAVDLLTEKLHQSGLLGLDDMRRLVAFHRGDEGSPADVKPYCLDGENEKVVRRVRIMLSTCSSAAVIGQIISSAPRAARSSNLGFTHVFIDEVCQATEPECMIPISLLSSNMSSEIILAGDPMQLGAVLRSDAAKYFGLDVSFVERLMELPLYQTNKSKICNHSFYDSRLVTKLRHNYRSHPALLSLTSKMFYADELIASASTDITDCLTHLPFLSNNKGFPLLFHGIRGDALREGNSPSWFNPQEVVQVVKYLQTIIYNDSYKLSYDDVGIITPYRKQVEKIRLLMEKFEMPKVKVGSVEEFQGQERLAIILSTVRSTESVGAMESCIQFLSNPKRFNVSITRAHALLVVVGNPHVLVQDIYWNKLLKYCVENKAYVGCDLPDLNTETQ